MLDFEFSPISGKTARRELSRRLRANRAGVTRLRVILQGTIYEEQPPRTSRLSYKKNIEAVIRRLYARTCAYSGNCAPGAEEIQRELESISKEAERTFGVSFWWNNLRGRTRVAPAFLFWDFGLKQIDVLLNFLCVLVHRFDRICFLVIFLTALATVKK